jgi:hypothetical protein
VELTFWKDAPRYDASMDGYVPISGRTAAELLAKAAEMRRMAETATTVDVLAALLRLAERYEVAAAGRRGGPCPDIGRGVA